MTEQIELRWPAEITWDGGALFIPETLPFEEWTVAFNFVRKLHKQSALIQSDLLRFGLRVYGKEKVLEASGQLEFEMGELPLLQRITNHLLVRSQDLSPEHHFVLAHSKLDKADQEMWAKMSVKNDLRPDELRESIRIGTVTRLDLSEVKGGGGGKGLATFEALGLQFAILRRQIAPMEASWTLVEINQALECLRPILEYITQLSARLVNENAERRTSNIEHRTEEAAA